MKKVEYTSDIKNFVDTYDLKSHAIWDEASAEILKARRHIRAHYLKEQDYRCAYCRIQKKEKHGMTWDVEHILPKSKYPEFLFEPENLAIACRECNNAKDNDDILQRSVGKKGLYPSTSGAFAIVHPHYDVHSDHIEVAVVYGKRRYRVLNKDKGKRTYIACNFFRFDYEYGEWDSFDDAIVNHVSAFLDKCPTDATPQEVKRQLGHMSFVVNCDF